MGAYFQMGHDTENLVGETDLEEFTGIVLSPVNREPDKTVRNINNFRDLDNHAIGFDIVLDSQLYVPRTNRGHLTEYIYFPSDLETADLSSENWWKGVATNLAEYAVGLGVNAVTSPVSIPRICSPDYYALSTETSIKLSEELENTDIRTLLTLLINFNEIGETNAALNIASIVSAANPDGYYLVISSDMEPRREFVGEYQLAGIMELINVLESTGKPVLVSHCSSEMILYKAAGATHCATGKFFNLRRFTKTRYEEPSSGGGQLPYWFEHSFLAFLRQADLARLQNRGFSHLLQNEYSGNYWSAEIIQKFADNPGSPWLALGWRQYLSWFGKTEQRLCEADSQQKVEEWLEIAEQNWAQINDNRILLDEPANNGSWIRNWRQSLIEFSTRLS